MPIATPEVYAEMLDKAKKGGFAYPAINCTSSETINAALRGFAEAESDGIIQFSLVVPNLVPACPLRTRWLAPAPSLLSLMRLQNTTTSTLHCTPTTARRKSLTSTSAP